MDPMKAAAEWLRSTVFTEKAIRPRPPAPTERIPSMLRTARSLETGVHYSWQSREALFLKQAKLLANYEDEYDYHGSVTCYYPTYQSLTNRQLRGYFSWRTRLRRGEVREAPLSFAFLYIYELINQVGVTDPMDGYCRLSSFRDAYGRIDNHILPYLGAWLTDYVVYYGLDRELLADAPQVVLDRGVAVLEHIEDRDEAAVIGAVRQLSKWLGRSKFYGEHQADMDAVAVRVLRRVSAHYAARCKKTMAEQYFGVPGQHPVCLFDTAVFCNPLKRKDYQYAVDEQYVYTCKNGFWTVWKRTAPPGSGGKLDALLKTIDSIMRQEYGYRHPVKAGAEAKWLLKLIHGEVQGLLAEKRAAEESKVTIDYAQLAQIRRDASLTQEKLIVEEDMDIPETPAPQPEPPQELEQMGLFPAEEPGDGGQGRAQPLPAEDAGGAGGSPLAPAEYRLLQCLLYGGDPGWVQGEGWLLSVLVDGINEKLYDTFLDCVLDDTPRLIDDYIDDLKGMVRP